MLHLNAGTCSGGIFTLLREVHTIRKYLYANKAPIFKSLWYKKNKSILFHACS